MDHYDNVETDQQHRVWTPSLTSLYYLLLLAASGWQGFFLATLPVNQMQWAACNPNNEHSLAWSDRTCKTVEPFFFIGTVAWQMGMFAPLMRQRLERPMPDSIKTMVIHFATWLCVLLPARAGLALWLMNKKVQTEFSIGLQFLILVSTALMSSLLSARFKSNPQSNHYKLWNLLPASLLTLSMTAPLLENGRWDFSNPENPHGFHWPHPLFYSLFAVFMLYLTALAYKVCTQASPAMLKPDSWRSRLVLLTCLPFSYYLYSACDYSLRHASQPIRFASAAACATTFAFGQIGLFKVIQRNAAISSGSQNQASRQLAI